MAEAEEEMVIAPLLRLDMKQLIEKVEASLAPSEGDPT